jgi:ATP-grasp domain, R2K clade family 3
MDPIEVTKFYIRHREGYPETVLQDYAHRGFAECGIELGLFEWIDDIDEMSDLGPTVGVAGYIGDVHRALKKLGRPIPMNVDYPKCLEHTLHRNIRRGFLGEVRASMVPVFVKPVQQKEFTGMVWYGRAEDRRKIVTQPDDVEVWISERVTFRAEYRSFILNDVVLDVRRYKGDWSLAPDRRVVEDAVATLALQKQAPRAYSLDWGIDDQGRTLLVEMNDSFALGHYGLHPVLYARMLSARWYEMTSNEQLEVISI